MSEILERDDSGEMIRFYTPTTFRQVQDAGIVLDGVLDDDGTILDALGYVRAVAEIGYDSDRDSEQSYLEYSVEVLEARPAVSGDFTLRWYDATPFRIGWTGGDGGPLRQANARGTANRWLIERLFTAEQLAEIQAARAEIDSEIETADDSEE